MRLALICLSSLLVLAPFSSSMATPGAGAQNASRNTSQNALQDALKGFWTARKDGGTVVCLFSGSIWFSSSPAGWEQISFAVRDGLLYLRPCSPGQKDRLVACAMEGDELVIDGTRLRRLPKKDESFGLAPDIAGWTRSFAQREHALKFCNARQPDKERRFVEDFLEADPNRRALYILQRATSSPICIYDPVGWCLAEGIKPGSLAEPARVLPRPQSR